MENLKINEIDAKKYYELLLQIKNSNYSEAEIKELITKNIDDTYEKRMVGSLTNSPISSKDWYNTLLIYIRDIGEYIKSNELSEKQKLVWGENLSKKAQHLLDNFEKIPFNY